MSTCVLPRKIWHYTPFKTQNEWLAMCVDPLNYEFNGILQMTGVFLCGRRVVYYSESFCPCVPIYLIHLYGV